MNENYFLLKNSQLNNLFEMDSYLKNKNKLINDNILSKNIESIFIKILIKSMNNTLTEQSLFENNQSKMYSDMYNEYLSDSISNKGIGLSSIIEAQLKYNKIKNIF
ncbi:Peptidoglycan hydrolase FlgJ [Buchnera aphidicola (Thelaxes suberi)]|uniref:rod-binding protein n=1 Tax=Buchnera aphidicola TaxID=9 RepID=UPI003464335B